MTVSLVYRLEADTAASGTVRKGTDIRESASRYPNHIHTSLPTPVATQVRIEPASVALKETGSKKKVSTSTKRHNIRRAKAHRAKTQHDTADQVENISIESTDLLPLLDYPVISPLPPSPEHIRQDSAVQVNRSLSGSTKATDQYTVVQELEDEVKRPMYSF